MLYHYFFGLYPKKDHIWESYFRITTRKKGNDKFFLHVKQSKNDISPKCHLLAYHYMF